ncbi:hypothetical protein [Chromobacterium haemolyticum]|uniref:hypothetical protein n=1 Tax=Chromobacterium haemolyticum TaxID=394935 RepID=UPI000DEEBC3C|nr:hypothetical protein [Chromobacterium haemolyticum]
MRKLALGWLLLACAAARGADAPLDEEALRLADQTRMEEEKPRDLKLQLEASALSPRPGDDSQRLSFDLRWDGRLSPAWRGVLANRLDWRFAGSPQRDHGVNTLKEAYLSREFGVDAMLDLGRVNTRYGVAVGYNPTDFLGAGTVRSVVSADPDSLRQNRLGNAMLRWQRLWDRASLTAIWSPKLGSGPNSDGASLDWGASNPRQRLLLAGSYRFAENLNPQWLLLQEQGRSPQLGFNVSRVLGNATVVYLEWAGGRQQTTWRQSLGLPDSAWRNRLAGGLTWTGANKLSLTLEGQQDGAAPDGDEWRALREKPALYGAYRAGVGASGGLPTRRAALLRAHWQDALVDDLDLTAMRSFDLVDHSGMNWAEVRYHLGAADLALQWQRFDGAPDSRYGASPARRVWQLLVDYFY